MVYENGEISITSLSLFFFLVCLPYLLFLLYSHLYLSAHPFRPQCLPGLSPFGLARRNHLTAPTRRNYRLLCTTCAASVSLRSALQESIVHLGTSTPCCNRNLSRPNHRPPRAYTEEVQFGESSHAWAEEPKEEATFFSPPVVDLAT
jgi:hypothetical protein